MNLVLSRVLPDCRVRAAVELVAFMEGPPAERDHIDLDVRPRGAPVGQPPPEVVRLMFSPAAMRALFRQFDEALSAYWFGPVTRVTVAHGPSGYWFDFDRCADPGEPPDRIDWRTDGF